MNLDDLIAKLEAAPEGSPYLSCKVHEYVGRMRSDGIVPMYTTSIYAAMMLVGQRRAVDLQITSRGRGIVWIGWKSNAVTAQGATAALALTIAALKALRESDPTRTVTGNENAGTG